jgi:hypothetical protein
MDDVGASPSSSTEPDYSRVPAEWLEDPKPPTAAELTLKHHAEASLLTALRARYHGLDPRDVGLAADGRVRIWHNGRRILLDRDEANRLAQTAPDEQADRDLRRATWTWLRNAETANGLPRYREVRAFLLRAAHGRAPRAACNTRSRGSRRGTRASSSSSDDPGGDPEPPGLRLWRHPRWGAATPNLLRLLLEHGGPR